LRANGSRECAPDDRLGEAIQRISQYGCAPRNDDNFVRQSSPLNKSKSGVGIAPPLSSYG